MTWELALSQFENQIADAELALREGQPFADSVLHGFVPRDDLGPFPPALAPWAAAILARNNELTQNLATAMITIENEMASTAREVTASKGYAPSANDTVSRLFDKGV